MDCAQSWIFAEDGFHAFHDPLAHPHATARWTRQIASWRNFHAFRRTPPPVSLAQAVVGKKTRYLNVISPLAIFSAKNGSYTSSPFLSATLRHGQ